MAGALRAVDPARAPGERVGLLLVSLTATAGILAAVVVDVAGRGAFPTHPVSALALGLGALGVWLATADAPRRSATALRALALALLAYLWFGVAACAVADPLLASWWSAGWIPINGLIVVVGLTAAAMPRSAVAVSAVTVVVTLGATVVAAPTRPFEGLPPAAPEAWTTRLPWLGGALEVLFVATLVAAVLGVLARVVRAHVTERRHLVNCAATTSMGLGLVAMCVSLAALRDPGDLDPSTGSVGYVAAIAVAAVLAAYGNAASRWPLRVVLGYWALALAGIVGVLASLIEPAALGVALTVAVAAGISAGVAAAVVGVERWLVIDQPRLVTHVAALSPRENEVLAAVAAGATNAGVAAELFLSERTVEQHLRSIFAKLDLGTHDSSNRRVRAAAIWWRHQPTDPAQTLDGPA